jgi:hypothetical protein
MGECLQCKWWCGEELGALNDTCTQWIEQLNAGETNAPPSPLGTSKGMEADHTLCFGACQTHLASRRCFQEGPKFEVKKFDAGTPKQLPHMKSMSMKRRVELHANYMVLLMSPPFLSSTNATTNTNVARFNYNAVKVYRATAINVE